MHGGATCKVERRNAVAPRHFSTIEKLEAALLPAPQLECPPVHRFVPGAYVREVTLPADGVFIGHKHKREHMNIILSGRGAVVLHDGTTMEVIGPVAFVSPPGVRKAVYVLETMVWQTVHTTKATDFLELEAELIEKSETFKAFEADVKRLKELANV